MWLSDLSIRRPVLAVMLIGALVGLGWVSLGRVGVDFFPKVEIPIVSVTTVLEGAAPETVESEVTEILEEELSNIAGLDQLSSVSSEGQSLVVCEFLLEVDADAALQEVRDKVAAARRALPREIEPPLVSKIDPESMPMMSVIVAGDLSIAELTRYAKDGVEAALQRVPGVGSVDRVGGREREVRVWLDALRLRAYGVTADDVVQALQSEHADVPGGRFESDGGRAELSFKTEGEVGSVAAFADLVIVQRPGGPVRVGDVAVVEDGLEDARTYAELDGRPGVSLDVRRQTGTNAVEVSREIRAVLDSLRARAPPGVEIVTARDTSRFVEASVRDVTVDLLLGGILAVLATLAFLRSVRSTVIVATAIPASIVSTFLLFWWAGFTLNLISMIALTISIGILIDDAIVVLEAIYRRIEAGEAPMQAAAQGTAEVGPAVVAATLAIVVVFVPISFMEGMIGRFFFEYGLTVVFAVLVSLLVAFTLTPMLSSRLLRREASHGAVFETLESFYRALEDGYTRALTRILRHRAWVVALGLASVVAAVGIARSIPLEFNSHIDRSEFEAVVELPLGTGLTETRRIVRRAADELSRVPHVENVFTTIGADTQGRVSQAQLYVGLTHKSERDVEQAEVMEEARSVLAAAVPDAKRVGVNEVGFISGGGFSAFNLSYSLQGPRLETLAASAERVAEAMRASGLYVDVTVSYDASRPEVRADVDRSRAADLGVSLRGLATTLRALVGGIDATNYEEGGERYDVRVRLRPEQRDSLDELGLVQLRTRDGGLADLASLARLELSTGPVQIERENRVRKIDLFANLPPDVALGTASDALDGIVASAGLGEGYAGFHRGWGERMRDSLDAVKFAFLLALTALYMVLASQFNSYAQPLVVMATAPLSFVGAFAALAITGVPLSMFGQIALLALMGLVMKNGILLVDRANQLRAQGVGAREAMLQAGPVRLRPVLMTTFSTVAGMIPVALSSADGAEFRIPMGVLAIGGMLSSTLLTLAVVPVVYTLLADAQGALSRATGRRVRPELIRGGGGRPEPPVAPTAAAGERS
ncbi:MAG: efflux RND transporter permease subunit [Myxococcales bacterium]|nr:efflux RND transporter permease subunit [Myxococcales bacterium]